MIDIDGKDRVRGITLAEVGRDGKPIAGTEEYISCDTLLLSVGLVPENELSRGAGVELSPVTNGPVVNESLETSLPGVFACGNVLHVHDLVDYVSEEAHTAGKNAAKYVLEHSRGRAVGSAAGGSALNAGGDANPGAPETLVFAGAAPDEASVRREAAGAPVVLKGENGVRYTVPSTIAVERMEDTLTVRFRVGNVYRNAAVCTYFDDECVSRRKKMVLAPGEMENVVLKKKDLADRPGLKSITIRIEQQ